jgi:hypothetical protein
MSAIPLTTAFTIAKVERMRDTEGQVEIAGSEEVIVQDHGRY